MRKEGRYRKRIRTGKKTVKKKCGQVAGLLYLDVSKKSNSNHKRKAEHSGEPSDRFMSGGCPGAVLMAPAVPALA